MKLFQCQKCGQLVHFENTSCQRCGSKLGYLPHRETMTALAAAPATRGSQETIWRALADREDYRLCANSAYGVCNWLVTPTAPDLFCAACRHNRTIPDLSLPENLKSWRALEVAKHRLFYTLLQLRLPLATKAQSPAGLAFEFLSDADAASEYGIVLTGHANGMITINLAEADDAERERRRHRMGEPYRTLLGHFRHEIGHYYWDRLIAGTPHLGEFRRLFGDEREDYARSLQNYYSRGAPADWTQRFISAYASAHPWEDFAESFAHYFHMLDTLETAHVFGLAVSPTLPQGPGAVFDFHPRDADMKQLIEAWLALTFAVNAINRSMGLHDLYPFVLNARAIAKLGFVAARLGAAGAAAECASLPAPAA
jgi:hypothetical protein